MDERTRLDHLGLLLVCLVCCVGLAVLTLTGHDSSDSVKLLCGLALTTGGAYTGIIVDQLRKRKRRSPPNSKNQGAGEGPGERRA